MSENNYNEEKNQNESYDSYGYETGNTISGRTEMQSFDYEDEDELERIPLEQEPTMEDIMSELEQKQHNSNAGFMNENRNEKKEGEASKGMGAAAMVLGIFAVLLFCIPIAGQIFALAALISGIAATVKNKGKKMGISGILMGTISLIAALIILIGFSGGLTRSNVDKDTLANAAWRRADDGSVLYLYDDGTFIHVDQEGVFTDNFYSGTYVILPYEDTNLSFTGIESQYDTDYAYDVYLYVNQYVSNGQESENIVGTIRYLYIFDKKYSDGDAVSMCAHDSGSYGDITPALETELLKPTVGNCYEPAGQAADAGAKGENGDTTEIVSETITESATEINTEETVTEQTGEGNLPAETEDAAQEITENGTEGSVIEIEEASSAMDEVQEEASSALDEVQEEASSALDEFQEEASSALDEFQEEASSAAEEMNDFAEDISDNSDVNQLVQFIRNLWQKVLDIVSNLGF